MAGSSTTAVDADSSQLCFESNMQPWQFSISAGSGASALPPSRESEGAAGNAVTCVELGDAGSRDGSRSDHGPTTSTGDAFTGGRSSVSGSPSAADHRQPGRGITVLIAAQ